MTTPPPPDYAPTAGLKTTWWEPRPPASDVQSLADRLGQLITETPEARAGRQHAEREAAFEAAGETADQRKARHRAEKKAARRQADRAARLAKEGSSGRARRFRRWCVLTALSASAGYAVGLPQLLAPGGPYVGLLVAAFGWALDLRVRGWGDTPVSEIRRPLALAVLVVVRVPLASGLLAALDILT
jgi:uncharacterized membrane protein YdbT with pleckstrin-like domain